MEEQKQTRTQTHTPFILIVDDNSDLRRLYRRTLTLAGYATKEAINGVDAIAALRASNNSPALILLDLMMPVMDGWQLLQIRENDAALASVPVVVCSAADKVPDGVRVLRKPVDPDALIEVVEHYCGRGAPDGTRA